MQNKEVVGVSIYFYKEKAYIPTEAQVESGFFIAVDPVYIMEINKKEITETIGRLKIACHETVPNYRAGDTYRKDPILKSTGAKSWKSLAKIGYCYGISWSEKETHLEIYRLDSRGRWEYDPEKSRALPPDTPIETAVDLILTDYQSRYQSDLCVS